MHTYKRTYVMHCLPPLPCVVLHKLHSALSLGRGSWGGCGRGKQWLLHSSGWLHIPQWGERTVPLSAISILFHLVIVMSFSVLFNSLKNAAKHTYTQFTLLAIQSNTVHVRCLPGITTLHSFSFFRPLLVLPSLPPFLPTFLARLLRCMSACFLTKTSQWPIDSGWGYYPTATALSQSECAPVSTMVWVTIWASFTYVCLQLPSVYIKGLF